MKKIAIDARMYGADQCSGIGYYLEELTKNLFKIDQENQYILFLREPIFSRFKVPNKRVKKVLAQPRWYTYKEQIKLPFIFAKEKFDLIHYPQFNSPLFYCKKSVCTIHDITPLFFPGHKMKSKIRRLGYHLAFRSTLKKSQKIITVSEQTKQDLIKHLNIKPNKINVTLLGVDENFKISGKNVIINKVKQKIGVGEKPYIFFICAWRSHKNFEGLIKAFNLLKERYQIPHQLVLGGQEFKDYPNIRQEINKSKYKSEIITPGYIKKEDLPYLYEGAEVFTLPSFREGFGLIAIEAQACGTPVISSNTTSLPEVLQNSALFFDPHNIEEMANKILQALQDKNLQKELVTKGLENVKRFSWKKCAEQTLEIYKEVLK